MSIVQWYALIGICLFGMGLAALVLHKNLLRRVLALNIMGTGVFLVFVALARRSGDNPDPVPLAMVLTGLVVSVSATALLLVLIVRLKQQTGVAELSEETPP